MDQDFLWRNLSGLPYFRALLRAVEAKFYQPLFLPSPTLDLGCGDGDFARLTFSRKIEVGLDPWAKPLWEAKNKCVYHLLVQSDGGKMPFPKGYFGSALSNSVLEHIPQVEFVMAETARVLKPGAPFIFCVPNHRFDASLSAGRFFDRLGFRTLGNAYRSFFEKISRHVNLDSPETWQKRLEDTGFALESYWNYFSPSALSVLEWGHYFGLPSLIAKRLSGRWILAPAKWNLYLTEKIVRKYFEEDVDDKEGVYSFFVARRR